MPADTVTRQKTGVCLMELTNYAQKMEMVKWAGEIKVVAEKRGDTKGAAIIEHEISEFMSGKFLLTVMGKVKRGKSTFCNAFIGRNDDLLDPVDKLPCSSVISKFIKSDRELVVINYQDGRKPEETKYARIREYVTEEFNPENQKNVESVEVYGKFQTLEDDLVLIDTPGAGSLHKHHDAMLLKFIPQSDAVIFLVTSTAPIAEDELELLKELKAADIKKVFFAVNMADKTDDKDMETAIEHNRRVLSSVGISVEKIYQISARNAMQGKTAESGFQEILFDISAFISKEKINILRANFISNVLKVAQSLDCGMRLELDAGSKSTEDLQDEIDNLSKQKSEIERIQGVVESEFKAKWRTLSDELDNALVVAEGAVEKKILDKIESSYAISAGKLAKELPAFMEAVLAEEITPYSSRFENGVKEITDKLRLEYPSIISIGANGAVSIGSATRNSSLLKGTIGGAMIAGIGGGAVAAASSSAALIVTTTATTAAAPSAVTALGGFLSWLGLSTAGNIVAAAGTGTALTTTTTTALAPWAALAGPIGWALIGVGALVVPVAFFISKAKQKDKILECAKSHVKQMFSDIRNKRLPALRKLCDGIVETYRAKVLNDLAQISGSLETAMRRKKAGKPVPVDDIRKQMQTLDALAMRADGYLGHIKA